MPGLCQRLAFARVLCESGSKASERKKRLAAVSVHKVRNTQQAFAADDYRASVLHENDFTGLPVFYGDISNFFGVQHPSWFPSNQCLCTLVGKAHGIDKTPYSLGRILPVDSIVIGVAPKAVARILL